MRCSTLKLSFIAMLAAGILIPRVVLAEYGSSLGSYNSSVSAGLPSTTAAVQPAGAALGSAAKAGEPGKGLQDELTEKLKKAQKDVERSGKENELRGKVSKWRDDIDRLKITRALPDILQANILKRREQENKDAQKFFSQLTQAQGVSGADVNTSNMEQSCRSGVDFQQFKALADQLGTEPFKYLRDQGQQMLDDKNKEAKEAKIKNLQKLASHFEKIASQDDFQQDVTKADIFKNDNSVETSIRNLEITGDKQKKEIGDLRKDIVKSMFSDLLPQLSNLQENDQKLSQLANFFADNAEQFRRASLDAATAGAQRLKANCEKNVETLGGGNPLAPNTLFNSAYQWVARANPDFANREFLQSVSQISQNLRCTDAVAPIEDLFGSTLQNAINQVRGARDPKTLLQGAMATLQAIGSAQAQVGQALQPLMDDCNYAAQQSKKIRDYIGQVQGQVGQASGAEGGGQAQRRSASSRRGGANGRTGGATGTNAAHTGSNSGSRRTN